MFLARLLALNPLFFRRSTFQSLFALRKMFARTSRFRFTFFLLFSPLGLAQLKLTTSAKKARVIQMSRWGIFSLLSCFFKLPDHTPIRPRSGTRNHMLILHLFIRQIEVGEKFCFFIYFYFLLSVFLSGIPLIHCTRRRTGAAERQAESHVCNAMNRRGFVVASGDREQ